MLQHQEQIKHLGDAAAVTAVALGWLEAMSIGMTIAATFAALVWSCLRIYEMFYGRGSLHREFKRRRRSRK